MKVEKTITIDSEHSVEFGGASWDETEKAVRRRKDLNGKFDVHSSSEIPINGHVNITDLYLECLRNDYIDPLAMTDILNEIIEDNKSKFLSTKFIF